MPFNSVGAYTPAAGATTAAPGDIIKSSIWNAIFTDLTAALTLLGEQIYAHPTNVTSTPYVPLATDTLLYVNVAGPVTINLPTGVSRAGYPLKIKDISGAANTNTITINRNGSDTIDGITVISITAGYGGYSLMPTASGWLTVP